MALQPHNGVLITGACGMVGSHLIDFYHQNNEVVVGTYFRPTILYEEMTGKCQLVNLDVRNKEALMSLIDEMRPQVIFHLAAQSYPTVSWEKPIDTFDANVNGTIHLFEAIRAVRTDTPEYDPMVVVACSSAEYGASLKPENVPINEQAELLPLHPYGVSKVAQDLLAYQYWAGFGIRSIRARIFNTTGPRKQNDAAGDFTKRAIEIEKGLSNKLRVGNLTAERAITDVRDMAYALRLLAEKGRPGEAYNICGEKAYPMSAIIDIIQKEVKVPFEIWQDPALMRPTDEAIIWGDNSKLKADTGWEQTVSLDQTITDMLNYWRANL